MIFEFRVYKLEWRSITLMLYTVSPVLINVFDKDERVFLK
jgi:hypothetical protein